MQVKKLVRIEIVMRELVWEKGWSRKRDSGTALGFCIQLPRQRTLKICNYDLAQLTY
jgi:hypothetical protein